jgi:hypothetical protein
VPAGAASFVTGSYSYDYELVLGDGTSCNASPATRPCTAAGSNSQNDAQHLTARASLSNRAGADNVSVAFEPEHDYAFTSFAGFRIHQGMDIDLGDATTAANRTAAAVDGSFHSRMLVDMTTPLQPDYTTEFRISFSVANDFNVFDLPGDVVWSGEYRLNDLTTGSTLASLSATSGSHSLTLDFATFAGHELELLFDAAFSTSQPSGFSAGFSRRGFTFDVNVFTEFTVTAPPPIPEPATAAMLAMGLCVMGIARRRCRHQG